MDKHFMNRITLSVSLILFGILLVITDTYAEYSIYFMYVLVGLGIFILSIEFGKLTRLILSARFSGSLMLLLIWLLLFKVFHEMLWVKVLISPVLFLGIYGVSSGTLSLILNIIQNTKSKKEKYKSLILFLVQIIGAVAAMSTIIQTML